VATSLFVLACALAVLGALTPGSRLPALAIGNLLGGLTMLALALRWFEAPRGLGWAAVLAALLVALQVATGGLVSSSYAATSCVSWQDCAGQASAAGWSVAPLDPWRAAALHGDGAIVQIVHRALGAVTGAALLVLAALAWRHGRMRAALALAALLLMQAMLGWAVAAHGGPLALVLLHNALAAALLALTIRLA
jgi:cytochrome c oxidase assembly protein subunit 15